MTTVRARVSFLTQVEDSTVRTLAGQEFDSSEYLPSTYPQFFVDASSVPWATYAQIEPPETPVEGETWLRMTGGYPDAYGVGLFRWDGSAWQAIGLVRLDDAGHPLGLVTIGADGGITAEVFDPDTHATRSYIVMGPGGQIQIREVDGGSVTLGAGYVTVGGGLVFPTSDPGVAGVWYDDGGVLTKSAG